MPGARLAGRGFAGDGPEGLGEGFIGEPGGAAGTGIRWLLYAGGRPGGGVEPLGGGAGGGGLDGVLLGAAQFGDGFG
ncbi:MAG: hypothetical protein ABR922_13000, partial [Streptosporangiaceae bacterium]